MTGASSRTPSRFLTREQVAEELATSKAQVYALLRRGDLRGIKIGDRGQWRIERSELEDYIQRMYGETKRWVEEHTFDEDLVMEPGAHLE